MRNVLFQLVAPISADRRLIVPLLPPVIPASRGNQDRPLPTAAHRVPSAPQTLFSGDCRQVGGPDPSRRVAELMTTA
jgi:hypothetical protein